MIKVALEIWSRFEISRSLRYVHYLGDGDSKGFITVPEAKPYSSDISIEKLEYVGHVQKRMGRQLIQLCKDTIGQNIFGGKPLCGRGRLTSSVIDQLQNYYDDKPCHVSVQ